MRSSNPDLLKAYALKVWKYKQGEMVSLMIHMGRVLGLYEVMAGSGALSSDEVAARASLDERWVREWLLGQAAAGLISRGGDGLFELEPEGAEVFAEADSLSYAAPAFAGGESPDTIAASLESFRTGRGVTFGDLGPEVAEQIDMTNAAWLRTFIPEEVIPLLDGVEQRLIDGIRVADVGCGGAVSVETLARRYPNSTFVGYEPSGPAFAAASKRVAEVPNASVVQAVGEELPAEPGFDLVMTLDCMHDVPFPDRVAQAIKASLTGNGTWLIRDIRCSPVFEENMKNPVLALQYGYSLTGCLASATSEEGGAALGTVGFNPEVAEGIARSAGFSSFETISLERDPVHLYYRVAH